jgi:NAD(P)-dependent dehydrogenase (short-subunit alcohol dehydrogenase family)/broad specificity phosphatase PhoE
MAFSPEYLGDAEAPADLASFYFLCHDPTILSSHRSSANGEEDLQIKGRGTDTDLNETVRTHARMAGCILKNCAIRRTVSSPLLCAARTAGLAGFPDYEIESGLAERNFGRPEGGRGPRALSETNDEECEDTAAFSRRVAAALVHVRQPGTLLTADRGVLHVIALLLGVELRGEHLELGCALRFKKDGSMWTVEAHQSPAVLISGANRGIGSAIAKELIAQGYRVSLAARQLYVLKAAFGPENKQIHFARFDAEEPGTMEAWVSAAFAKLGRIDGLVNNAGYGEHVHLKAVDYEELDKQWRINAVAPLRLTELCLPYLKSAGSGRIVNIGSMSGIRVLNSFVGYNMTKFALRGLTQTTLHDAWNEGVRVTSICPGFVRTDMSAYATQIAPEEMIQPETIAKLVRHAIELPNNASVPEIQVRCQREPQY